MRVLLHIASVLFVISNALSQNSDVPRIINIENKFGLVDVHGNVVLSPIYDTLIAIISNFERDAEKLKRIAPVFIFTKDNHYGYSYEVGLDTLFSYKVPIKSERYWQAVELIYDTIVKHCFACPSYTDTVNGYRTEPYYIFKYKLNNKWGLLYIKSPDSYLIKEGYRFSLNMDGALGESRKIEAVFDEIDNRLISKSLYIVKLNGKWSFLQVMFKPPDYDQDTLYHDHDMVIVKKKFPKEWVGKVLEENYDTIPKIISNEGLISVRKNNKWGVVRIDPISKELEYVLPCVYHKRPEGSSTIRAQTDSTTVIYNYDGKGKIIDLPLVKNNDYNYYSNYVQFKQYGIFVFAANIEYQECTNYSSDQMYSKPSFIMMVIDTLTKQLVDRYVSTDSVMYDYIEGHYPFRDGSKYTLIGILIKKKVKSENGFIDYYIDFETNKVMFSIPEARDGECYQIGGGFDCYCEGLVVLKFTKNKKGKRLTEYKGYYDFNAKAFIEGKCKGCEIY